MKSFYLPIFLAICGGTLYHIAQKSIPKNANPLAALFIAYLTSLAAVLLCLLIVPTESPFITSLRKVNWAMFGVGIGAAAIEIGFLLAYRAGGNISTAGLIVSISVALLVIPVGLAIFQEQITTRNFIGILLCILGLILITRK